MPASEASGCADATIPRVEVIGARATACADVDGGGAATGGATRAVQAPVTPPSHNVSSATLTARARMENG
jgi:hypothetical protein